MNTSTVTVIRVLTEQDMIRRVEGRRRGIHFEHAELKPKKESVSRKLYIAFAILVLALGVYWL